MDTNSDLDFTKIINLISSFVAYTTCVDCNKFFELPERAECGHAFCHTCWRKRHTCGWCAASVDLRLLKQDFPLQIVTDHVRNMCEILEKTFDLKVDTFSIGHSNTISINKYMYEITTVERITSTAQVHSHSSTKKVLPPPNLVVKQEAQVDWEKIEQLPDSDEFNEEQNLDYESDPTKNIKRCLRRSQRLFSISLSAESAEVNYTIAENIKNAIKELNDIDTGIITPSSKILHKAETQVQDKRDIKDKLFEVEDELNCKNVLETADDHTKHATELLANSGNYFNAPNSLDLQDIKTGISTAQIHSDTTIKKMFTSPKILTKKVAQDDWDKIEKATDHVDDVNEIVNSETDSTKNITDWLANSEKYYTFPICSESKQNITNKNLQKVIQDDWDKIEQLSDNDNVKQTKTVDDINEYSLENPRRSSRKREYKYYAECHYYPLNIKRRKS